MYFVLRMAEQYLTRTERYVHLNGAVQGVFELVEQTLVVLFNQFCIVHCVSELVFHQYEACHAFLATPRRVGHFFHTSIALIDVKISVDIAVILLQVLVDVMRELGHPHGQELSGVLLFGVIYIELAQLIQHTA